MSGAPRLGGVRLGGLRLNGLSLGGLRLGGVRIGLGVGVESVRAVAVRADGRPLWAMEAELEPGEALDAALGELLAGAPPSRGWPRPRVTAAVGPARAQAKGVDGMRVV